jgi:hypothetical protein
MTLRLPLSCALSNVSERAPRSNPMTLKSSEGNASDAAVVACLWSLSLDPISPSTRNTVSVHSYQGLR